MPPEKAERPTVVRLRDIQKTFGQAGTAIRALRGVTMDIAARELVMLVGPSGCGKTTLLSIVCGVLDADEGAADVFGVDWCRLNAAQKTARRASLIGYVFQQFNLIPTLNILDNVSVPLLIQKVDRKVAIQRAAESLEHVGLKDRLKAVPSQLSGGQQQRVAIARALVAKPPLLVCDEPTANLDSHTGQKIMEIIRAASHDEADGRKRCVIVVTHDARLFPFADRIEQMEDGRLVGPLQAGGQDPSLIQPRHH